MKVISLVFSDLGPIYVYLSWRQNVNIVFSCFLFSRLRSFFYGFFLLFVPGLGWGETKAVEKRSWPGASFQGQNYAHEVLQPLFIGGLSPKLILVTKGVERWGSRAVRKGKYLGSALAVDGTEPEASKKYFQRGMHAAALRLLGSFCGPVA